MGSVLRMFVGCPEVFPAVCGITHGSSGVLGAITGQKVVDTVGVVLPTEPGLRSLYHRILLLGVGFKHVYFHPYLGKMNPF